MFLAERGLQVETLDLSAEGVAKARALATRARRGARRAAGRRAAPGTGRSAAYDVIALLYLHLPAAAAARAARARAGGAEARRLHRAGGVHAARSWRGSSAGARGGPREAALLYSAEDLRGGFRGREIELLQEVDVELREGALHVGRERGGAAGGAKRRRPIRTQRADQVPTAQRSEEFGANGRDSLSGREGFRAHAFFPCDQVLRGLLGQSIDKNGRRGESDSGPKSGARIDDAPAPTEQPETLRRFREPADRMTWGVVAIPLAR